MAFLILRLNPTILFFKAVYHLLADAAPTHDSGHGLYSVGSCTFKNQNNSPYDLDKSCYIQDSDTSANDTPADAENKAMIKKGEMYLIFLVFVVSNVPFVVRVQLVAMVV